MGRPGGAPQRIESGRLNPGYLKLDLMCRGMRIAPTCTLGDGRFPVRMRSGLGSGLELRLPGGMPVNVPVREAFAAASPYVLESAEATDEFRLTHEGRPLAPVRVAPRAPFLNGSTRSGRLMASIGVLQGNCLGVYFGPLCANWKRPQEDACRFCAVGVNAVEGDEAPTKTVDDVVETACAARDAAGITFVHVNGGYDDDAAYLERFGALMRALRDRSGLLLGLQIPPLGDLASYRAIRSWGVDNVSLCFEQWDDAAFRSVCPGKQRRSGLAGFRRAIQWCARDVGFATTNGEMILGLEPPQASSDAVDWLVATGAIPTLCVFRPVVGTAYANRPPPDIQALIPVFAHAYRRVMERGLPVGVAPGVSVSIVLTPEEWRWLLPPRERRRYALRRALHACRRGAASGVLRRRMGRARRRRA